eukprot:TRINITY_DN21718_c0_g1_i1.p1 TRINITY_DN21718_c0_g1~~TRINITY_DN21718_c0_g1_i1.p1  ORF type:complete len:179 (+),score=36.98 TRINITY_DN21718_c0_g1_i1:39-539(+)
METTLRDSILLYGDSEKLGVNVADIFEVFNVNDRKSISIHDVTVALRMLGVDVSKDVFRKEILPNYPAKDDRLSAETFKQLFVDLRQNPDHAVNSDAVFSDLDSDQTGVITAKSLQALSNELLEKDLEKNKYSLEELEEMVADAFNSDHITKERLRKIIQQSSLIN